MFLHWQYPETTWEAACSRGLASISQPRPHHSPPSSPSHLCSPSPAILAVLQESAPLPLSPAWMACSFSGVPGLMLDSITSLVSHVPHKS